MTQSELNTFLDRYSPEVAKVARATLRKLRKRLPTSIELVYDNYNGEAATSTASGQLIVGSAPGDGQPCTGLAVHHVFRQIRYRS